jgi:hypothetical protein
MRTPRFSIRSLLAAIAILGIVLAMLRSSLPVWANAAYTVAIIATVAGASRAIVGREARRAYWVGFSLFGATYLMMSDQLVTQPMLDLLYPYLAPQLPEPVPTTLVPPPVMPPPPVLPGTIVPPPVMPEATASAPPPVPPVGSIVPPTFGPFPDLPTSAWEYWMKPDRRTGEFFPAEYASYSPNSFRRIGHSFVALLAAMVGGAFVRWRYEEISRNGQAPEVAA